MTAANKGEPSPRPRSQLQFVLSFALRVANAAGQLLLSYLVLRTHGSETLGVFTVVLSNSLLITLLTRRGFDRTLILFQAKESVRPYAGVLFRRYTRTVIRTSPLAALISIGSYWLWMGPPTTPGLAASLAILPAALALSALAAGYFSGGHQSAPAMIQQPGFAMGLASVAMASAMAIGHRLEPIATLTLAASAVALFGIARVHRSAAAFNCDGVPRRLGRAADRLSRSYLFINFFTTFTSVFFFSFLALFVSALEIGHFRSAERVAQLLAFNLTFINVVLPGSAIRAYYDRDLDAFARYLKRVFQFQYLTTLALFICLVAFRAPLMRELEIPSVEVLLFPMLAQLVNALTGPVRILLMYLGANAVLQMSVVLEFFWSIVLYWTLYAGLGLRGISIAYFLAIPIPNLALAAVVYRRFGVLPLPWATARPPRMAR